MALNSLHNLDLRTQRKQQQRKVEAYHELEKQKGFVVVFIKLNVDCFGYIGSARLSCLFTFCRCDFFSLWKISVTSNRLHLLRLYLLRIFCCCCFFFFYQFKSARLSFYIYIIKCHEQKEMKTTKLVSSTHKIILFFFIFLSNKFYLIKKVYLSKREMSKAVNRESLQAS